LRAGQMHNKPFQATLELIISAATNPIPCNTNLTEGICMAGDDVFSQDDQFTVATGNRLAHFEDCRSAIDQLFLEALSTKSTQGTQAFDEFLDFVVRFSNMSIYNAMLVMVQRRGAGAVATRNKWEDFGRTIKPDAIPIVILRPFGPVAFVFEQGDTEGRPLPGAEDSPLFATGELSQKIYDQTRIAAEKYEIQVEESEQYGVLLAGTAAGFSILPEIGHAIKIFPETGKEKVVRAFRIRLNARHDLPTRFATLAHELGHIYCGHVGADSKGRWPARLGLSYEIREAEAEAVCWLVCQRNGVKSRSREYLSKLMKNIDQTGISPYAIFEAANRVESRTPPMERR